MKYNSKKSGLVPFLSQRPRGAGMLTLQPANLNPEAVLQPQLQSKRMLRKRRTLRQHLDYVAVLFLSVADSMKRCSHCGARQIRHYETVGPMEINLDNPPYQIIYPRVSNNVKWFRWKIFAWLLEVPDYKDPKNWFLLKPQVRCTGDTCPNHELHSVEGRHGLRKLNRGRRIIESLFARLIPWRYTYHKP